VLTLGLNLRGITRVTVYLAVNNQVTTVLPSILGTDYGVYGLSSVSRAFLTSRHMANGINDPSKVTRRQVIGDHVLRHVTVTSEVTLMPSIPVKAWIVCCIK
jgi:hypothetical protein